METKQYKQVWFVKSKAVFLFFTCNAFALLSVTFSGCLLKNAGGDGAKELARTGSNRLHVIQLDVTNEKQIEDAVTYVKLHLPKGQKGAIYAVQLLRMLLENILVFAFCNNCLLFFFKS